jgi:hypothetical protein
MFLGLVVYFSHWFSFAGYALTIGSYEINQWWRTSPRSLPGLLSRTAIASTQFIVPCALFLTLPLGMTGGHTSYLPLAVQLTQTLRSPTWFPGTHFDVVILGFAFGIALIGFSTGFLRLCPAMRLPLAALCIAALVMPHDIKGVTENELRLPVAVVYFAIAACRFNPEFRVTGTIVAAVIAALIIVNTVSIELWFLDLGKQYDEFLAALPVIKPGSRLLVFSAHKAIRADLKRGPTGAYQHMADVAVIEDDVFLPYLFKNPIMTVHATDLSRAIDSETGHPISVTQLWDGADAVKGPAMLGKPEGLGVRNFWGDWPHHFDYVVGLTFGADVHLPPYLTAVHAGSFFNIYKVTAPASK